MDPVYYILGGAEALVLAIVVVRLRAALGYPSDRPKARRLPILLFTPRAEGSQERKESPSRA